MKNITIKKSEKVIVETNMGIYILKWYRGVLILEEIHEEKK